MTTYAQDYLKTVVPSQLISERGSNLVVINPGSANVRVGFAHQQVPFSVRHCIARYFKPQSYGPKHSFLQDEMLNCEASPNQNLERERAYDIIASLLKIPFLDEEAPSSSLPPKMGLIDSCAPQQGRSDSVYTWTNVKEKVSKPPQADESTSTTLPSSEEHKDRRVIFGEDALKVSPSEPYCLRRPIRRGHFNISQNYSFQQACEDIITIWNWILTEKLNIHLKDRKIKEMLSIVLRDLRFSTAVVHQEGLAAAFGNGLSTACVVNIGAQITPLFVNLIAFEHCNFLRLYAHFSSFALFLNLLVNTQNGAMILQQCGIIENWLVGEEEFSSFFNLLNEGTQRDKHHFLAELFREVNKHCQSSWNKQRAKLIHDYFSSPWTAISLVAGLVLLVLTCVQSSLQCIPTLFPRVDDAVTLFVISTIGATKLNKTKVNLQCM